MTDENRQQLVNAGAIPVLVSLLNSQDTDVQYYCTTALSNIAVDGMGISAKHYVDYTDNIISCESKEARTDRAEACIQLSSAYGQSQP